MRVIAGIFACLVLAAGSVRAQTATSLALMSSCPTSGENLPVTFHATVQVGGVTATAATGTVTFLKGGMAFGSASLVDGKAYSATLADLPVGSSTITAQYAGDAQYGASAADPLTQTVLAPGDTTIANSMMSITIAANAAITSVRCVPTGGEMLSTKKGFYIYHQKSNTTIPFTRMARVNASQLLFWSDNGPYYALFNLTCPDRYFKIELARVSNNPQTGDIDSSWPGYEVVVDFNINPPSGYALQNLKMDYMTEFPYFAAWYHNYNFVNIHWQNVQYSQITTPAVVGTGAVTFTKTVPEPMGAVGFYLFKGDAEHDDILADMWSGETCMVRPNQAHLASWTKADIRAWLDRYERELFSQKTLAFVPSGTPDTSTTNQFYQVADKMYAAGFDTLLLWNCWGGSPSVDSIDTSWFGGALGMTAFKDYCAQRGIRLNFHSMAGYVTLDDPVYGAVSPNGLSPQISRWATGTLLNDIDSNSTSFNVKPDPGCQMLVNPAPWSGATTIYYPPYNMWDQGIISIGNDILYAKATEVDATTWSVDGNRNNIGKYGQQWGMSHKAGTRVDFLTSYYGSNTMVDSRSDLLINVAERFAGGVLNKFNLVDVSYDGNNVNIDLGNWGYGKYSTYVQKFTDHPVTSSYAGNVSHGHFEDVFKRIQKTVNPVDGYPAFIRLADPSFIAPNMDEMNFAMGQAAKTGQKITVLGGHIGSSLDMINTCGLWDQVGTNMNLWMALQAYLTTEQKNLVGSHFTTWSYEFYEPSVSGSQWLLTPKSVMARPAVDEPFFNMQEFGAMSPRQFNKAGETVSGLTNKYAAQSPEIELYVLPGMNAADSQNVSMMPASASAIIHPVGAVQPYSLANGVINLTVTNSASTALAFTPGIQDYWNFPINMTSKRGIAFTVTGDNSGAQLVLKIKNGGSSFDFGQFSCDYVITLDFTGERTIEIPSGEVMWHRKNPYGFWSDYSTVGGFGYSNVTGCQVYLGRVPANTTASVQISAIKAMKEDQTTGLVNPTLTLNGNTVAIAGTVPYNHYLVYSGGGTAKVYDGNWHFMTNLTASGATLTAQNGANNAFSVAASASPNTWLTTRMKVSGAPLVIDMPAASHEWRFETDALDSVGTAHGTALNGPTYVSGKEGDTALSFNGTNPYVTVPDAADLRFTATQSFTLSAWVKINSLPNAWAGIVNKGHDAYGIWLTPDNQWAFGGASDVVSSVTATVGAWHLLTAVQDGTTGLRKLYVDGVFSVSGIAQDCSATNALFIGATSGAVPGEFLNGAVDDVRLYPTALGGGDIKLMFDGPRQATEIRNRNATGIGSTTAVLNATLAGAGADYQVHACWGTVDGGTTAGQWTHTADLGTFTNAVWTHVISYSPAGLQPNTQYYFTTYATTAAGTTTLWAPEVMSFTTPMVAPVAAAQSATTAEDTATAITLTGSASGGGTLTYGLRTYPAHGSLTGVPPDVTYTPWANYNGADSFSFAVNDGSQDSAAATVSLTVSPVNDAPAAIAQSLFTLIDTPRAITLRGTDTENDALSSVLVSPPAHGTLTGTAPNLLYTPDAGYSGLDGFTFKVNDGLLDSAPATIDIAVRATQTVTWADSAASTSWAPGTNWLGGESPVAGDDVVLFGRTAVGAFAPAANGDYVATTLNSLKLQSGVDGDVALSLAQALQVDGGGIVNQSSATLTIPSVTMTADQSWGGTGPVVCSSVAGYAKLTAAGASLQINAASTHSGGTSVTSGNLKLGHAAALAAGPLAWQSPGGVFSNTAALSTGAGIANAISLANDMAVNTSLGSLLLSGTISGAGGIRQTGSGTLTLAGANSYSGGTTYAGPLTAAATGALGTGSVTGTANSSLSFNTPTHATFGNNFTTNSGNGAPVFTNSSATATVTLTGNNTFGTGSTWAIIKGQGISAGGVVLTGSNDFQGRTLALQDVSLTVGNSAALGSASILAMGDTGINTPVAFYLQNGVAISTPVQDVFYTTYIPARSFTLGISQAGSATLSGTVDLHKAASAGSSNWNFDAVADATLTCSGVIKMTNTATGLVTVTKTGAGTLVLTGSNTYIGTTTVSSGTLRVNNVSGSGLGTGAVVVASGATLAGTGAIGGAVTVNGTLTPGISGSGILAINSSLTVGGSGAFQYGVGNVSGLLTVNGNLTLGGTLNLFDSGGLTSGTYRLMNYTGSLTNNGMAIGSTPTSAFNYQVDTSIAGQVNLRVLPLAPADGISIQATHSTVSESGTDTGMFTLTRTGGATGPLTVNLTIAGSATNGTDYSMLPSTVSFLAAETTKTIAVTPISDGIVEGSETVIITIDAGDYAVGSPSSATVTILDGDALWSTAATSTSWATAGNWVGNVLPTDDVRVTIFGRSAGGTSSPSDNSAFGSANLKSLSLQAGPDGGVGVSLASALRVGAGGVFNNLATSGTLGLASAVLTADQTWGGTGPITCGAISGNSQLTFSGSSLRLNAASTYSGGTVVTGTALAVGNAAALGTGTLTWTTPSGVFSNTVALTAGSGIANTISLVNDMSVNTSLGSLLLSGAISGSGGIRQTGSGTLALAGANRYSGGTTYAGTLTAAAAGAFGTGSVTGQANTSKLSFITPTSATFPNNFTISTAGNDGVVFTNSSATSTITLSGNNTLNANATWDIIAGQGVAAGGVVLTGSNNFGSKMLSLKDVSLTAGNNSALGSVSALAMGQDAVTASALYLQNAITISVPVEDIRYGTYATARTFTLGINQAGSATLSGTVDLHKAASAGASNWNFGAVEGATLTCSGVIKTSNTATGKATLTKTGAGTVVLSGANTCNCDSTVAAGTLSLTKVNPNNETSRITIATGAFLNLNHLLSDTVGTLYLDAAQQPAGTYVANGTQVGAQIGSPRITGTGKLVVSSGPAPPNDYATWISGFSVGGLTGANDDFDHDGIGNAVENILGSNPTLANTVLTAISATVNTFKFRHTQSNTIAVDLTKSYQWSSDLVEWKSSGQSNAGGITATIAQATLTDNAAPDLDLIEVTVTVTSGPAARVFVRLVATKDP